MKIYKDPSEHYEKYFFQNIYFNHWILENKQIFCIQYN